MSRLKPRCYITRRCDLPDGHPGPWAMTTITSPHERKQIPIRKADR